MIHNQMAIRLAIMGWGMSSVWVIDPSPGKISKNKGERKRNKSTRWC